MSASNLASAVVFSSILVVDYRLMADTPGHVQQPQGYIIVGIFFISAWMAIRSIARVFGARP